ncbi:hypothetical protein JCM6882_004183 [Rhodosporidiobolus microsporus]
MSSPPPHNVLFIIADDLGFSDVGCYGGEISTPNIDSLAKDGLRMLNYHTAQACSPTRAMVMTGTDAHIGGLGCLLEHREGADASKRWKGKPGYEGYLNKDVAPLSEVLQDNGYHTILSGKWHLGLRTDHGPHARGFDKSFSLLPGCANHMGWEPQLEDGWNAMKIGGRPLHVENGKRVDIKPNKTEDPAGFYSSDAYSAKFVEYLSSRTEEERKKPFFGYLAYSAPHWPNQAPRRLVDKYDPLYRDGPYELRKRRLANLVKLGIISPDTVPHYVVHGDVSEWNAMSEYEQKCSVRSMAAYAAMVEQMDVGIGKVLDALKASGEYDNTTIVFMSDNGAEGAAYEAIPVFGQQVKKMLNTYYDNRLENIGNWNSFTWIGPLWAQASTAPSRMYKCYSSEGGILVPCVVKSPLLASKHQAGGFSRAFTTCMDLMPTVLDHLEIQLPAAVDSKKVVHRGRPVHPMRGKSLLPFYRDNHHADPEHGESAAVHHSTEVVGWEMAARAALRQGRWKIVHFETKQGGAGKGADGEELWELFDVEADPGETTNLAQQEPERLKALLALWDEYVAEMGVAWGPSAMEPGISLEEAPHLWDVDFDQQRSWMQTPAGETAQVA